jgi:hypothetical protein
MFTMREKLGAACAFTGLGIASLSLIYTFWAMAHGFIAFPSLRLAFSLAPAVGLLAVSAVLTGGRSVVSVLRQRKPAQS